MGRANPPGFRAGSGYWAGWALIIIGPNPTGRVRVISPAGPGARRAAKTPKYSFLGGGKPVFWG